MNINQRAAFAAFAIEEDKLSRKRTAKKNPSKANGKMKPVSRKGKNKFKY
jgi:hypothetical protein